MSTRTENPQASVLGKRGSRKLGRLDPAVAEDLVERLRLDSCSAVFDFQAVGPGGRLDPVRGLVRQPVRRNAGVRREPLDQPLDDAGLVQRPLDHVGVDVVRVLQ